FFFQAEDGIRDRTVTGVQTCALPIFDPALQLREFYHWDLAQLKGWIDLVGADRTSIGSDLGQTNNPLPIDSFKKMLGGLHDCGVSEADLRKMVRDNPARLLGLN